MKNRFIYSHFLIKSLASLSLLLSGIVLLWADDPSQLCLYGYIGSDTPTYFNQFFDTSANDPVMFTVVGILSIFFGFILGFLPRLAYGIMVVIFLALQLFAFWLIETTLASTIIFDSILYCHNWFLLGWVIGQAIFWLLSICYLKQSLFIKKHETTKT